VSVARKIGSERHPREVKLRGHPTMVLAKAHLSKNSRYTPSDGEIKGAFGCPRKCGVPSAAVNRSIGGG
jgi:hypothetical protein